MSTRDFTEAHVLKKRPFLVWSPTKERAERMRQRVPDVQKRMVISFAESIFSNAGKHLQFVAWWRPAVVGEPQRETSSEKKV